MKKTKVCSVCKKEKNISDFGFNKNSPDGLSYFCKSCNVSKATQWAKNNPEKRKNARKNYIIKYPEKVNEQIRKWNSNHPENVSKRNHLWRSNHPNEKNMYDQKRRAMKMNALGDGITSRQWKELKESYGNRCAYCNKKRPLTLDHIVPLSKNGAHDIANAIPACKSCNSKKRHESLLMFMYRMVTNG